MASRNRGAPKPTLRNLSRQPPTSEELEALYDALESPQPITRAILGGVLIENELEAAIKGQLPRKDDATWTLLTEEKGPLGSFFQKIEMGYALNLYSDETKRALHIVRGVRNAFAHARRPIDFKNELVLKELRSFPPYRKTNHKIHVSKQQVTRIGIMSDGNDIWTILIYILSTAFRHGEATKIGARTRRLKRKIRLLQLKHDMAKPFYQNRLLFQLFQEDFPESFQDDQNDDPKIEALYANAYQAWEHYQGGAAATATPSPARSLRIALTHRTLYI